MADPPPGRPANSAFVVQAPTTTFSFRDSFSYTSISAMLNAGWTKCGTTDPAYYQVSGGTLTLINDGSASTASGMCWQKIPSGVSNWMISTSTAFEGGGSPSIHLQVIAGGHNYRVLDIGGGSDGALELLIDGNEIGFGIPSYIPPVGVWHLLGMQMRNGQITVYSEGISLYTYQTGYTDTSLTMLYMTAAWLAHDSYDWLTANQFDPNAPDFNVGVNPSHIATNPYHNATFTVSIASVNNFTKPVGLTAYRYQGQYPTTVKVSPSTLTPSSGGNANSSLTISTNQVLTSSSLYIIVNATSGSLSHQVQVILDVNVPPPDFRIDPAISTTSLVQRGDGSWPAENLTITLYSISGFSGNVEFSASSILQGLSGQFFPHNVSLPPNGAVSTVLQVSFNGQGANGFYELIGYATSGIMFHPIDLSVYIVPSYFSIDGIANGTINPVFVAPALPATFTLTLTSHNNFSGTINLATQLYPAIQNGPVIEITPATVKLNANQITTITVTVTVVSDTPTQTYQATITANGRWWTGSVNLTVYPARHSFKPGISPGTWVTYDIALSSFPQTRLSATLTILEVHGTNVTYKIDFYIDQVLQNSTIALTNVYFGTMSNPIIPVFLVPSSLLVGDLIYAGQPQSLTIQTQQRQTEIGAARTVNIAGSPQSLSGLQIMAAWDATTGLLFSLNATIPTGTTVLTASYLLTGTNAWTPHTQIIVHISSQEHAALLVPIRFTSIASGGTPPYSYSWNFGDGATSTEANPSHSYLRSGNYTVTLQVRDSNGNTESGSTQIAVSGILSPQTVISIPSIIIAAWPTIALSVYLAYACLLAFLIMRQQRRWKKKALAGF